MWEANGVSLHIPRMPDSESLIPYLKLIDNSKIYSNHGPLQEIFVERLSKYLEVPERNIVLLANATLALQAAISTYVGGFQSWQCPSWTFTATPCSLTLSQKKFRFVDIDNEWRATFDLQTRESLMDVAPFGAPIRFPDRVSDEQGFIIDAAASFDSLSRVGLKENSPYVVVVSLHATKVFGVGEGAFVFSNDIGWVDRIKSWSRFGFKMGRSSEVIGNNAKMSEYSAAVGLANFDIWNETLMKYREVNSRAREISNSLGLRTHYAMEKGFISPYWIIELGHKEQKRILQKSLIENEIPFRDWWEQGCHNMPAFNSVPVSDLTKTVMVAEKTIGLPFHTYLSETYWEMISELLQSL